MGNQKTLLKQLSKFAAPPVEEAEIEEQPEVSQKAENVQQKNVNLKINITQMSLEEAEEILNGVINSELVTLVIYNARPTNPGIEDWGEVRDKSEEPISLDLASGTHTWERPTELIKDCIMTYRLAKKQPDMVLSLKGGKTLPVTIGLTQKGNVSFRILKVLEFNSGTVTGFTPYNTSTKSFGRM